MSDLLSDARKLRQRIYRLEVLLEVERAEKSRRRRGANAADQRERAPALARLLATGLIETAASSARYRLTPEGRDFLKDVRAKVGGRGELDWMRADEIDFSKL